MKVGKACSSQIFKPFKLHDHKGFDLQTRDKGIVLRTRYHYFHQPFAHDVDALIKPVRLATGTLETVSVNRHVHRGLRRPAEITHKIHEIHHFHEKPLH